VVAERRASVTESRPCRWSSQRRLRPTPAGGRQPQIPQVGTVEDDVEIGANATIDRAALGATVIGRGTKIDNLR
jgi:hypothetical protein